MQTYVHIHTPSTPGAGSIGYSYAYQMEWNIEHHTSAYSVLTHTLNHQMGSKGKKKISERGHVAYQISDLWVRLMFNKFELST